MTTGVDPDDTIKAAGGEQDFLRALVRAGVTPTTAGVITKTTPVNAGRVATLFSNPQNILPATDGTVVALPVAAVAIYNPGDTPYGANPAVSIKNANSSASFGAMGLNGTTAKTSAADFSAFLGAAKTLDTSSWELTCASADPTGGNGTLKVIFAYILMPVG